MNSGDGIGSEVVCRRRSARRLSISFAFVVSGWTSSRAQQSKPALVRKHRYRVAINTQRRILWGPGSFRRPAHIGGEFDPGSGSTLAACLMHASRTGLIFGSSHVADGCGARGQAAPGRGIAGGNAGQFRVRWPVGGTGQERVLGLTLGGACGRLARWGGNGFPRR
jgi:hypothetical protein